MVRSSLRFCRYGLFFQKEFIIYKINKLCKLFVTLSTSLISKFDLLFLHKARLFLFNNRSHFL